MADKRAIKQQLHRLQRVKTWQLLVVFILLLVLSATFLRINNIGMIERRDAVIVADKEGDMYVIQNRIYDLQAYSSSKMNASTGPIYLTEQYKRDAEKWVEERRHDSVGQETIYAKADKICKERFFGYSQAYVQCVANEIEAMPNTLGQKDEVELPNPALYKVEFASPDWSPDFAGFSVLTTALLGLYILLRMIRYISLRILLGIKYRNN